MITFDEVLKASNTIQLILIRNYQHLTGKWLI